MAEEDRELSEKRIIYFVWWVSVDKHKHFVKGHYFVWSNTYREISGVLTQRHYIFVIMTLQTAIKCRGKSEKILLMSMLLVKKGKELHAARQWCVCGISGVSKKRRAGIIARNVVIVTDRTASYTMLNQRWSTATDVELVRREDTTLHV